MSLGLVFLKIYLLKNKEVTHEQVKNYYFKKMIFMSSKQTYITSYFF